MSECNCDCHEIDQPIMTDRDLRVTAASMAVNCGRMLDKESFAEFAQTIYDFIKGETA